MKKFIKHNLYILKRILPLFIFFFIFQTILRISFIIWEYKNIEFSFLEFCKAFIVGSWFDLITLSFFLIPYILYLIFLPKKFHLCKIDQLCTRICYFILIYLLIYDVAAEWVFWDEFHVRYNFIAIDYLIYTDEVLANIWESYPIIWILIAIAILTLITFYFTKNLLLFKTSENIGEFKRRFTHGICYCILVTIFFYAANQRQAEISLNNYINEITKNGIFSLFSAFRNNELNFDKFYLTKYQNMELPSMQKLLQEDNVTFINNDPNDITRLVKASGDADYKNVIIVMLESFSANFMQRFGGENLTPNLDKLANESLFFSKFYATGTRTVRGMEAITLSIPPTPGRSIVKRPHNENLASLGFVFKDRQYDTKFIYGGYGYFDNMNYFYGNNGFTIIDRANFAKEEQTFANAWGLCDEDLFNKTIKEANKSYNNKEKFMYMVMTTSNHRPYTFPTNTANIPTTGGGREAGVKYTDYAIGKFLDKARKEPWFTDTVFVFIADHTAGNAGKLELTEEKYHIPLFIYAPSFIKPYEYPHLMSQIDFAPTLLGLLNFSYYSRFYGKNILKNPSDKQSSFIANYQKIGYKDNDILTILKPGKLFAQYNANNQLLVKTNKKLLLETISYYKHAANWRKTINRINSLTGENIN
jgi:phosphoglycerol transferase MdoB-like AlkP superfamily enzyme